MTEKSVVRFGLLAVFVLQIVLIMLIVVPKERTLATGRTVILQTLPVDPRDLFRGDYVVLRYTISNVANYDYPGFSPGDTVYVELEEHDGIWQEKHASRSKPDSLFIKGRVISGGGQFGSPGYHIEYGIETYFVPEGAGHIIERGRNVTVKVKVNGSGSAVIEEVLIDGRPFDGREAATTSPVPSTPMQKDTPPAR